MNCRKDFPIFKEHKELVYLDNAATSQKPKQVIKAISDYYEKENANIHRGVYSLSEKATEKYDKAREKIAGLINAESKEIIFTRNTTESINFLSNSIKPLIADGKKEIVLSEMEHHSNLIPWQQFAKNHGFKLKFIPINENYELNYEKADEMINENTALLAVTHASNALGTINDIKKLVDLAKKNKAFTIIDAAQSVPHIEIDVKEMDCDFMAFSSHKMFGPTGIGILYGKQEHLKKLNPFLFGGGMINSVSYENALWAESPEKFEAGTPNIADAIAMTEVVNYIENIGLDNIKKHEEKLLSYALRELKKIDNLEIYSPGKEKSIAVVSFNLKDIHPHDVASILNDENIAIRAGHHCCMPLMKKLGIAGTCRASFSIYNKKKDIDKLIKSLKRVNEVFKQKIK